MGGPGDMCLTQAAPRTLLYDSTVHQVKSLHIHPIVPYTTLIITLNPAQHKASLMSWQVALDCNALLVHLDMFVLRLNPKPRPLVDFSGEDVVERHMARQGRDALMQGIRDAAQCRLGSPDLDAALKEYGAPPQLQTAELSKGAGFSALGYSWDSAAPARWIGNRDKGERAHGACANCLDLDEAHKENGWILKLRALRARVQSIWCSNLGLSAHLLPPWLPGPERHAEI